MASKRGYVSIKVAEGGISPKILPGGEQSVRKGYVVQKLEVVGGMGLQLVTAVRQPYCPGIGIGSPPEQVVTAQEVYITGSESRVPGRIALAGVPVVIAEELAPETAALAAAMHSLMCATKPQDRRHT